MSRIPLPDEIVPVELLDSGNPNLVFTGRAPMLFEKDEDGRRIEWTTPEIARIVTSEPYNRLGHKPRFKVAEDKKPENLNIDQRVIEVIRRHRKTIAAILADVPDVTPVAPAKDAAGVTPPTEDIDAMDKSQLLEFAKDNDVAVDARWNVSKIREQVHRKMLVSA